MAAYISNISNTTSYIFPKYVIIHLCHQFNNKQTVAERCWKLYNSVKYYLNQHADGTLINNIGEIHSDKIMVKHVENEKESQVHNISISCIKIFWAFCNCIFGNDEIGFWGKARSVVLKYVHGDNINSAMESYDEDSELNRIKLSTKKLYIISQSLFQDEPLFSNTKLHELIEELTKKTYNYLSPKTNKIRANDYIYECLKLFNLTKRQSLKAIKKKEQAMKQSKDHKQQSTHSPQNKGIVIQKFESNNTQAEKAKNKTYYNFGNLSKEMDFSNQQMKVQKIIREKSANKNYEKEGESANRFQQMKDIFGNNGSKSPKHSNVPPLSLAEQDKLKRQAKMGKEIYQPPTPTAHRIPEFSSSHATQRQFGLHINPNKEEDDSISPTISNNQGFMPSKPSALKEIDSLSPIHENGKNGNTHQAPYIDLKSPTKEDPFLQDEKKHVYFNVLPGDIEKYELQQIIASLQAENRQLKKEKMEVLKKFQVSEEENKVLTEQMTQMKSEVEFSKMNQNSLMKELDDIFQMHEKFEEEHPDSPKMSLQKKYKNLILMTEDEMKEKEEKEEKRNKIKQEQAEKQRQMEFKVEEEKDDLISNVLKCGGATKRTFKSKRFGKYNKRKNKNSEQPPISPKLIPTTNEYLIQEKEKDIPSHNEVQEIRNRNNQIESFLKQKIASKMKDIEKREKNPLYTLETEDQVPQKDFNINPNLHTLKTDPSYDSMEEEEDYNLSPQPTYPNDQTSPSSLQQLHEFNSKLRSPKSNEEDTSFNKKMDVTDVINDLKTKREKDEFIYHNYQIKTYNRDIELPLPLSDSIVLNKRLIRQLTTDTTPIFYQAISDLESDDTRLLRIYAGDNILVCQQNNGWAFGFNENNVTTFGFIPLSYLVPT